MSDPSNEPDDDDELPPRKPRIASRRDTRQSGWAAYAQDPDDRYLPSAPDLTKHRRVGYVSIWVGSLPDKATLDLYVKEPTDSFNLDEGEEEFSPLWDDLGFRVFGEAVRSEVREAPISLAELVANLPGADLFLESLLAAGGSRGINQANAVIAIYGVDVSGPRRLCFGRLQYLGSFSFVRPG
jgi:Immunity protein 22